MATGVTGRSWISRQDGRSFLRGSPAENHGRGWASKRAARLPCRARAVGGCILEPVLESASIRDQTPTRAIAISDVVEDRH